MSEIAAANTRARPGDTVIVPPHGLSLRLREIWAYRELAWYLVLRSVKPRYRQTVLGFAWAVVPPFMLMVVFTIFMNRVIGVQPPAGVSYPVFSYSGLLLWQYFSSGTVRGSTSLLSNASFVTKVYFPRVLLPLSTVIDALFDLAVAFVVLIPLMMWYGDYPSWRIIFLPVFVLLAGTFALAVSLFVNSLGIQYRDLGLAIPLIVQLGLFATPVVYPITSYPSPWSTIVLIFNPVASAIQGFRWALVGIGPPPGWELLGAFGVALASLFVGMLLFNRMERTFSDEL